MTIINSNTTLEEIYPIDFPEIEQVFDNENGQPGLPGWDKPKLGDWRTKQVLNSKGYIILLEECVGYEESCTYYDKDGNERTLTVYVTVQPGFRATRIRKLDADDIPLIKLSDLDELL